MTDPETLRLDGDDRFPNSPLPVLIHRGALPADPAALERAFHGQGWGGAWRNGIYDYHHFHSIAHEVLGIAAGTVRVLLGGPSGREATVRAGDVLVIPAGVAHRNMGQSADLLVVGAYPGGAECDLLRGEPAGLAAAQRSVAAVPLPERDPVPGSDALPRLWRSGTGPGR